VSSLLEVYFNTEDEGETFLWNDGNDIQDYTPSQST
jgi:hypothetical protein